MAYSEWSRNELTLGNMSASEHRQHCEVVRLVHANIKLRNGLDEMDRLNRMLKEAKQAVEDMKAAEVANRFSQSNVIGTFQVTDN
jgi:hypothetical protein